MYIVTRRYHLSEHALKEAVEKTEREGLPEFRKIPGFVDYYYMHSDGAVMSISVFESRAGADEATRFAADWVRKNIPNVYAGTPEIFSGEVLIHSGEKKRADEAA